MSELNTEAQAEELLIGAVMGDSEKPDTEPSDTQDLDRAPSEEVTSPEDVETEKPEPVEAKDKADKADKTEVEEEDYVEIAPEEEGGEPTRIKLADLLASHREFEAFKGQREQVLERVEREAVMQQTQAFRQVEQYSKQAAAYIQAAVQMLQPPKPPSTDMLNPQSQSYNPDQYHLAYAQYQQAMQSYGQAQGLGQHLLRQAQEAEAQAALARESVEIGRLARKGGWFAEFANDDPQNPNGVRAKFASAMKAAYGYSWEELDAQLTDHRNIEVARDALAYRAMKAKGGDIKKQVEAKPKLVRSKIEAKGGATQQRDRDPKGRFVGDALAELKKTNSDDAAARMFAGLIKAGRI